MDLSQSLQFSLPQVYIIINDNNLVHNLVL